MSKYKEFVAKSMTAFAQPDISKRVKDSVYTNTIYGMCENQKHVKDAISDFLPAMRIILKREGLCSEIENYYVALYCEVEGTIEGFMLDGEELFERMVQDLKYLDSQTTLWDCTHGIKFNFSGEAMEVFKFLTPKFTHMAAIPK